MGADTQPAVFVIGAMAYVDSRDVARDFGIDHEALVRQIEEVQRWFPAQARQYRKRMAIMNGAEVHSFAISYVGFALLDLPEPHGANLKLLSAYVRALSAAHKEASR